MHISFVDQNCVLDYKLDQLSKERSHLIFNKLKFDSVRKLKNFVELEDGKISGLFGKWFISLWYYITVGLATINWSWIINAFNA